MITRAWGVALVGAVVSAVLAGGAAAAGSSVHDIRQFVPFDKGARFGTISPAPFGVRTAPSTPLQVRLLASEAPRQNEPVEVRLELHAFEAAPRTTAEIRLPAEGEVVSGVTQAVFDLRPGQTVALDATVRLTASGEQAIEGVARRRVSAAEIWADADQLYLTVGDSSTTVGYASGDRNAVLTASDPAVSTRDDVSPSDGALRPIRGGVRGALRQVARNASSAGLPVTISICMAFTDRGGSGEWLRDAQIELWDDDAGSADDLLNIGVTGYYNGCRSLTIDNTDYDEGGAVDVYFLTWLYRSGRYEVRTYGGATYSCSTSVRENVGANVNYGTQYCGGNGTGQGRAFAIFNDMYRERRFIREAAVDSGWGDDPGKCTALWQIGGTDGTYYSPSDGLVHLADADGNSRDTVAHECAHRYMHVLYATTYTTDCPSPHIVQSVSGKYCAWTEGWTYVLAAATDGNPIYTWGNGGSLNLETPNCASSGWDDGGRVEGRVGAVLIDMLDPFTLSFGTTTGFSNEGWSSACSGNDPSSGLFPRIWDTISDQNDRDFVTLDGVTNSFSNAWEARGYALDGPHRIGHLNSIGSFTHD
jgi:hypothetical protein